MPASVIMGCIMRRFVLVILVVSSITGSASAVSAQDFHPLKDKVSSILADAQVCAQKMSAIGFMVDEFQTEIDLTPKVDIYFRDVGGAAGASMPPSLSAVCQGVAKSLLATREVKYGGYRLKGVKVSFPTPRVVLIHSANP